MQVPFTAVRQGESDEECFKEIRAARRHCRGMRGLLYRATVHGAAAGLARCKHAWTGRLALVPAFIIAPGAADTRPDDG